MKKGWPDAATEALVANLHRPRMLQQRIHEAEVSSTGITPDKRKAIEHDKQALKEIQEEIIKVINLIHSDYKYEE